MCITVIAEDYMLNYMALCTPCEGFLLLFGILKIVQQQKTEQTDDCSKSLHVLDASIAADLIE